MAKRKYVKENNLVKAINTDSLELQKPLVNEYYDINVHNSNMDKIDKGYKQNKNDISDIKNELSKTENTKYTTTNGIKEFECKDGYVDNVVIEGKTLVNLANPSNIFVYDGVRYLNGMKYAKPNTLHTIINFSDKRIGYTDGGIVVDIGGVVEGKSSKTFTTSNTITLSQILIYGHTANGWGETEQDKQELKQSIVILEGDHTDKSISYFEGLKSVGQGDKIEVLSYNDDNIFTTVGVTKGKYLNNDGKTEVENSIYGYTDYIQIDNVEYNSNFRHGVNVYDANKQFIEYVVMDGYIPRITNAKYIRVNVTLNEMNKYIITKGKIDKKQILTTLRSLPNGVKDTIEKRGNKYYKIKRCGEYTINGSETNINCFATNSNCSVFGIEVSSINNKISDAVSDKFKYIRQFNTGSELFYTELNQFNIEILNSKLSSQNAEGLRIWLKSNPVTVVYELATPIIEELPNFNPQTFSDKTTLLLNSGVVQGEASFEVTNSLGSELEVLKNKVSDLDDSISDRPITKYELIPLNGWSKFYGSSYITRSGDVFNINIGIQSGTTTAGTILFHINNPSFIPKVNQIILAGDDVTGGKIYELVVRTNGTITVGSKTTFVNKMFITGSYNLE